MGVYYIIVKIIYISPNCNESTVYPKNRQLLAQRSQYVLRAKDGMSIMPNMV